MIRKYSVLDPGLSSTLASVPLKRNRNREPCHPQLGALGEERSHLPMYDNRSSAGSISVSTKVVVVVVVVSVVVEVVLDVADVAVSEVLAEVSVVSVPQARKERISEVSSICSLSVGDGVTVWKITE